MTTIPSALPSCQTTRGAERCAMLLEVATDLFLKHGYEHVSLDQIVEHAGGSKATIYKYFGNKKGLFLAICEQRRQRFIGQVERACQQPDVDVRHKLSQLLFNLFEILNDEKSAAFTRLIFNIAQRDSELAYELYTLGPKRAHELLAEFLSQAHQQGQIYCTRPNDSAVYFFGFFHDTLWRAMIGLPNHPQETQQLIEQQIDYMVERFLAGHQIPNST